MACDLVFVHILFCLQNLLYQTIVLRDRKNLFLAGIKPYGHV